MWSIAGRSALIGVLLTLACPLIMGNGCLFGTPENGNGCGNGGGDQCPNLTGTGTNPGLGPGRNGVNVLVEFDGDTGSASFSAEVPRIGTADFTVGPGAQQNLEFAECPWEIRLADVTFVDGARCETDAGTVVFDRSTDYACGQSITVTLSLPCNIRLQTP